MTERPVAPRTLLVDAECQEAAEQAYRMGLEDGVELHKREAAAAPLEPPRPLYNASGTTANADLPRADSATALPLDHQPEALALLLRWRDASLGGSVADLGDLTDETTGFLEEVARLSGEPTGEKR